MPVDTPINTYERSGSFARAVRALGYFGMHIADFAGALTNSDFDHIGKGDGYTVGQWIADGGIFANLAEAQAEFPIIQDGNDHVDWVLMQSAVDFIVYGALGAANRHLMKRKLFLPAGHFLLNRSLHIGYGFLGTPPANLNGNRYVTITIEGEGRQVDAAGNGMTGTTIFVEGYTRPGIVLTGYQSVKLRGFLLAGPGVGWMANNLPYRTARGWDRAAWNDPANSVAANQIGGAAVNIGIGLDLYSTSESAAAYPPRILPAYFGGGTSSAVASAVGGSNVELDDVGIQGFTILFGRPHGDANGEFFRIRNSDLALCVNAIVVGASQARVNILDAVNFDGVHTCYGSRGGLTGNANLHGQFSGLHFGRVFQIFDHPNADWSGPLTIRDSYGESLFRLGTWSNNVKLDTCQISLLEQEENAGVAYNHGDINRLILDNTEFTTRHGLFLGGNADNPTIVEMTNGSKVKYGLAKNDGNLSEPVQDQIYRAMEYMGAIFHRVGANRRILHSHQDITRSGLGNMVNAYQDERSTMTYLDQDWTDYYPQHPDGDYPGPGGSAEMQGTVQRYPVPKITKRQLYVNVVSRSGFDLICDRPSIGGIPADVGDVFGFRPSSGTEALRSSTWFMCIAASGGSMTLRQRHNYWQATRYDYSLTNYDWLQIPTGGHLVHYINTRIRQGIKLWVGDVTDGSAVIQNVRHAFQFGTTDVFTADNFNTYAGMRVGDWFLHQEIERSKSTGGVTNHNEVAAIDFTANTITLTQPFNINRVAYPIVFYDRRYNA